MQAVDRFQLVLGAQGWTFSAARVQGLEDCVLQVVQGHKVGAHTVAFMRKEGEWKPVVGAKA